MVTVSGFQLFWDAFGSSIWMDGHSQMDEMNQWTDVKGWMDGMDGWMDGMDRWMDGWNGWTEVNRWTDINR